MKTLLNNIIVQIVLMSLAIFLVGGTLAHAFVQMLLGDGYNYIIGYILSGQILIIFSIIVFGCLILNKQHH